MRRLITMVDAFYDQHVRLILTAQVPTDELFAPGEGAQDEVTFAGATHPITALHARA